MVPSAAPIAESVRVESEQGHRGDAEHRDDHVRDGERRAPGELLLGEARAAQADGATGGRGRWPSSSRPST